MVVYPPTDLGLGARSHAWSLASGVRLGCHLASGAVAGQQRFNAGQADAKNVGDHTRRAKPARVGMEDVLPSINRIASQAREASGRDPYDQGHIALGSYGTGAAMLA